MKTLDTYITGDHVRIEVGDGEFNISRLFTTKTKHAGTQEEWRTIISVPIDKIRELVSEGDNK